MSNLMADNVAKLASAPACGLADARVRAAMLLGEQGWAWYDRDLVGFWCVVGWTTYTPWTGTVLVELGRARTWSAAWEAAVAAKGGYTQ